MSDCYTRDDIAALLGTPGSPASDAAVRSFLSRAKIRGVAHYDAAAVNKAIATQRPGQGARTDIRRIEMQKMWYLETNAPRTQADVVATEIFQQQVNFNESGRLGLELASYDYEKLEEVKVALRARGRQAILTSHR